MRIVIAALLGIVGIIHLLPLSGVLGAERLSALYGMSFDDPNLLILMRHRAILFGLLGTLMIYASFRAHLQPLALASGWISVLSFLWLASSVGNYGQAIRRVVVADIAAAVCLTVATVLYVVSRR